MQLKNLLLMTATFLDPYDSASQYAIIATRRCTDPCAVAIEPTADYCLKDNFHVKGYKTTASSELLKDLAPDFDAFVVEILGKPKCKVLLDELGVGNLGTNTHNLRDEQGPFGGSSSGTMASMLHDPTLRFGICTDTGGSGRAPVVFRKNFRVLVPGWGQISRRGLIPLADPLDRVSIMARDYETLLQIYGRLNRRDRLDATCNPFKAQTSLGLQWADGSFYELLAVCAPQITSLYLSLCSVYFRSATDRYGLVYLLDHRLDQERTKSFRNRLGPAAKERLSAVGWTADVFELSQRYREFLFASTTDWMSPSLKKLYEFCRRTMLILELRKPSIDSPDAEYRFVNLLNLTAVTFLRDGRVYQVVAPRGHQYEAIRAANQLNEA